MLSPSPTLTATDSDLNRIRSEAHRWPALDMHRFGALRDELGDEPDDLVDLIDTFLEHTNQMLVRFRRAVTEDDPSKAWRLAHTMKGSGMSIGAARLAKLSGAVEASAYAGQCAGPAAADALEAAFQAAAEHLRIQRSAIQAAS